MPRTLIWSVLLPSIEVMEVLTDPQNGGYVNPPRIPRQFRDPHGDWWDKQERRNYGEPVHEDNDILGIFAPHEYTHTKPGMGVFQISCFVVTVLGLCGVVSMLYPDKPSAPREFEGGLERELGGPTAVRVRLTPGHHLNEFTDMIFRPELQEMNE